ncbi:Protein of unknown function [Pyronema omphalodes CBS 100304]|uniref:Uncharacterized protein n=1 Tax=Pyronema omphalodes (strain CBS 100304) TaxID=1076935 RepID=U4LB59_PYROM|nr:Protein of unknown function [Pyronema omphalodes CBS 100304]
MKFRLPAQIPNRTMGDLPPPTVDIMRTWPIPRCSLSTSTNDVTATPRVYNTSTPHANKTTSTLSPSHPHYHRHTSFSKRRLLSTKTSTNSFLGSPANPSVFLPERWDSIEGLRSLR